MKIVNHKLVREEGDPFEIRYDQSPNMGGAMTVQHLIVHSTQGPLISTVNWFKRQSGLSTHLVISEDGDEIVQMVPFNRRGVHAHTYNVNSIGIELEYPGPLLKSKSIMYRYIEAYGDERKFTTGAQNDPRFKTWPNFQGPQLETLVKVTRLLMNTYHFESILRHEEINSGKMDPGPMFPMITFREKLSGKRDIIMEETSRDIHLRTAPDMSATCFLPKCVPANTKVSVIDERKGWVLVEVMEALDGLEWQIGWIPSDYIRLASFTPSIVNDRLVSSDGAFAKLIRPAPGNYDPKAKRSKEEIKYLVMHITGGTNMQGVVNYFKNPTAGVSAHLVIGRDGRVVQFMPFDETAFHCGISYWENDRNLNHSSIGIEIDNAGYLRGGPGNWNFKGVPIPDNQVVMLKHWKLNSEKAWEKFPDIQLETAFAIAKALVEHYKLEEVIGHDEINLINRLDPGPAFPFEAWRKALFPNEDRPKIQKFRINEKTDLYEHLDDKTPAQNTRKVGVLGDKSKVQIRDEVGSWVLVRVVFAAKGTTNVAQIKDHFGWIEKKTIGTFAGALRNMSATDFYEKSHLSAKSGPPLRHIGALPRGTLVRRQYEHPRDGWTLVAMLPSEKRSRWLEGWVRTKDLVPDEEFNPVTPGHGSDIDID